MNRESNRKRWWKLIKSYLLPVTQSVIGASLASALFSGSAIAQNILSAEEIVNQLSVDSDRSLGGQSFKPSEGRIDLPEIQFEYNSAELTQNARRQVEQLGEAFNKLKFDEFLIVGHTDASGSESYNMSLSQKRAKTVQQYLLQNYNIEISKVSAVGKGESQLKNSNNPASGENRRVEVVNKIVTEN